VDNLAIEYKKSLGMMLVSPRFIPLLYDDYDDSVLSSLSLTNTVTVLGEELED
jgi:hypothetical protein